MKRPRLSRQVQRGLAKLLRELRPKWEEPICQYPRPRCRVVQVTEIHLQKLLTRRVATYIDP